MFVRLLLLFTLVPIVELAVLIEIGQHLGMLPTVALVLATGALGAASLPLSVARTENTTHQQGAIVTHID